MNCDPILISDSDVENGVFSGLVEQEAPINQMTVGSHANDTQKIAVELELELESIDHELESIFYDNSKLFSQIESEYLNSMETSRINKEERDKNSMSKEKKEKSDQDIQGKGTSTLLIDIFTDSSDVETEAQNQDKTLVGTQNNTSCSGFVYSYCSNDISISGDTLHNNSWIPDDKRYPDTTTGVYEYAGEESQEFHTPSLMQDYSNLERYWYSDEDLPPIKGVVTLDMLKNTPSLAYMYDFFYSRLSL